MSEPAISHYRILKKLGEGGMGEVYLAEDTRLKRKVALKRLSVKLGDNKEYARRFERETRAASALNHPNILTIYEIGQCDGRQFIAAEFVEGETLRQRLRRGHLAIDEALDIAAQTVSALAAAHEIGIIHRDIKPENIMLRRDELVKVVDFGLAKLMAGGAGGAIGAEDSTQFQTRENSILGTVPYMSPEQARGLPLDARTDLWSAGCVLYELITGRQPFVGASASDCVAAILRQEPVPAAHYVGEVPEELEQVIAKALTKEREERYQTANEMLADLRRVKRRLEVSAEVEDERRKLESPRAVSAKDSPTAATQIFAVARRERRRLSAVNNRALFALVFCVLLLSSVLLYVFKFRQRSPAPSGQINSLVVLPLKNIGGDAHDEYLSDGITDELITKLTKLKTVRVVSPSVAMRYKNSPKDAAEIGHELNVEAVIEGTVRKVGTRFRLSIHLVNAQDGFELWSDNDFESELNDLLDAERQIAGAVASRLKGQLTPQERNLVARSNTTNADAYELLLRGKQQCRQNQMQLAREFFDRAIQLDPNFADAYAWRGLVIYQQFHDGRGDRAALDVALSDANRALQIDPHIISARRTLINVYHSTGQYEEGLKQAKQALETDADDLDAIEGAALAYFRAGMLDKAIAMYRRAVAADPTDIESRVQLSRCFLHTREYQKGLDVLLPVLETQTGLWMAMHNYEGLKQYDKAIEAGKLFNAKYPDDELSWIDFGVVLKQAGKPEQARAVWAEGAKHLEQKRAVFENVRTHIWLGYLYAELREREKAVAQANRALAIEPNDAWTFFQVGAIHAILNNRREAISYVKQSIAHGWLGIHYINRFLDPDGATFLANLRDDAEFQQVRADLQKKVDELAAKY
jgi:serine/threonine-protein kinase